MDSQGRSANQASHSEERLLQAIYPEDCERLAAIWEQAYKEHGPYDVQYRLVDPDGQIRHNYEIGRPEYDESGRNRGHFGTTQDITNRKLAEEALWRKEQSLQSLTNSLEDQVGDRTASGKESSL